MMKKSIVLFFTCVLMCICLLNSASVAFAYDGADEVGMVDTLIRYSEEPGSEYIETPLGDVTADALRHVSRADVAIVNGGELYSNLQAGVCTWDEVQAVFVENREIGVASITPAQLWEILEHGVSYLKLGNDEKTDIEVSAFEGFPQISGIKFKYDISALPGERIQYVLVNDEPVARDDNTTEITLCATQYMMEGGYDYPEVEYEHLDLGLADALAKYISDEGTLYVPEDVSERHDTIGTYDKPLISRGTIFLVAFAGCVIAFSVSKMKSKYNFETKLTEQNEWPER